MSRLTTWRNVAAAAGFSVAVIGSVYAEDAPPLIGFTPIASVPTEVPPPAPSPIANNTNCQQSLDNGRPATWWERMQLRKWEKKRRMQESCLGYPEEFCEQPLGVALYSQLETQVANGIAAKLVLYHFDFLDGSPQLNSKGVERLARHVAVMNRNVFPLVIEHTPETPGLDEARRITVQQAISQMQAPIAPERVIVGLPSPTGLSGKQAVILEANLLRDTRTGGTTNLAPGSFRAGGSIQGGSGGTGASGGSYGSTGTAR